MTNIEYVAEGPSFPVIEMNMYNAKVTGGQTLTDIIVGVWHSGFTGSFKFQNNGLKPFQPVTFYTVVTNEVS